MAVRHLTHEIRLQEWTERVRACKSSGKSIRVWSAENGINEKTYYYWQKQVCALAVSEIERVGLPAESGSAVFTEIGMPECKRSGGIVVRIGKVVVEIGNAARAEVVEETLRLLVKVC